MTYRQWLLLPILYVAIWVAGCATPFDIGTADRGVTPREAAQSPASVDREIAWGGVIVNAKNLADSTQLEVIGYPLDRSNRPQNDETPIGRFIVIYPGYLETADYAPGREISVVGTIKETRKGKVGEAMYIYPVVQAKNLHLWPKTSPRSEPRFTFGIGIGILR